MLLVAHYVSALIKLLLFVSFDLFIDEFLLEELLFDDDPIAFVGCDVKWRINCTSFFDVDLLFFKQLLLLVL